MMRLYIDGERCDVAAEVAVPCGFDADRLADLASGRMGSTLTLSLPRTPANDALFRCSGDIYAVERFNASHHTARIDFGTTTLMEGTAVLVGTHLERAGEEYEVRITGECARWAEQAAHKRLGEAAIEFAMTLTPTDIAATWEGEQAVRFLPVCRSTETGGVSSALVPAQRAMLTDDYHPFISVAALMRAIMEEAGYTLESRFFESDFGRSLYVSGSYRTSDAARAKERMDFRARSRTTKSATADALGRVYASPSVALHSVGNVVDTASPVAVDESGKAMSDTFTRGDCFGIDADGFACFVPTRATTVGFLLHLDYTTDYRISSRTRLAGFDRLTALGGVQVQFALANTFADHRKAPHAGNAYRALVFDHKSGREYMLRYGDAALAMFAARSALLTIPAGSADGECRLLYRDSSKAEFADYTGDWALYDGYVGESGTVDVVADVRLPARRVSAGAKVLLDKIVFGGAEPEQRLTLSTRTSLRPVFSTEAGYGSRLAFADIAAAQCSQLDFAEAVARLFNLRFFTDHRARRVVVEPLEEFYDNSLPPLDWSARIDFSQPVVLSDAAIDAPQWRVFAYADGDEAVAEFNAENDTVLGEWRSENPLYGTKLTTRAMGSGLFVPSVCATGVVAGAPSAAVVRVGDKGVDEEGAAEAFAMHIVRYCGLRALPEGERWAFPHEKATYPYAAFFGECDGEPFTLGFEDRDGATGLHLYYDEALRRERERHLLRLALHLTPAEVGQLLSAECAQASFRRRFRLTIGGQSALYRLRAMADYDPARASTECLFERLTDDE